MKKSLCFAAALLFGTCSIAANSVPNPSFERSSDGSPKGWTKRRWGGKGEFEYVKGGRTGSRCVALSSKEGADISWLAVCPVKPFSVYRLSGWIKTENVVATTGRGALLNLSLIHI